MSLELILSAARRWDAARVLHPEHEQRTKAQVADAVAPHLGGRATYRVLQPVAHDNSNLLSTVEDTVGLFVGARAAAALVSRAVDGIPVRS